MLRESSEEIGITARVCRRGRLGVITLLIALLAPLLAPLSAVAEDSTIESVDDWAAPRTVYIPETGQTIDGVFLDYWRGNNGMGNFGNPVTAEHERDDRTVQYYQYARFEYVPDDPNGEVVQIANIGEELRPMALPRASIASSDIQSASAVVELALMTKAWLPLDESYAKRENTDSWRYVPEAKHSVANGFKGWWEAVGEGYLGNPLSEEYVLKGVTYQTFERGQLAWSKGKDVWLVPVGEVLAKKYNVSMEPVAQGEIPVYDEALFVAPEKPKADPKPRTGNGGERWIEVNLSTQYLIAWEGDVAVNETYVSTGRPGFETPTGTFYINTKLEIQDMEGLASGESWYVPDVPNVQYFTDVGHAFHGTYWHNNFGQVMSHGCVNLPLDFAAWLYGWTSIGTRVEIHY